MHRKLSVAIQFISITTVCSILNSIFFIYPSNKSLENSIDNNEPPKHNSGMNRETLSKSAERVVQDRFEIYLHHRWTVRIFWSYHRHNFVWRTLMVPKNGQGGIDSFLHATDHTRLYHPIIAHVPITCQSLRNETQSDGRILSMIWHPLYEVSTPEI